MQDKLNILEPLARYPLLRLPGKHGPIVVGGGATFIIIIVILAILVGGLVHLHPEIIQTLGKGSGRP